MRASTGRVAINLHGTEWLRERERNMDIFIGLETSVGKRRKDEHFHSNFFLLGKQFLYCFDLLAPSLESKLFPACL